MIKAGWRKAWIFVLPALLAAGCQGADKQLPDTPDRGTIRISCDESFKPAIDAQVLVYESQHPDTKIIVDYKPEAECLKDLLVDSVRMIIATRGVSEAERKMIIDSLKLGPEEKTVARDIIAVVINPASADSFFSMTRIRQLLSGKHKENLIPVFDGARETSTVRFMLDSVLRGDSLGSQVVAAQSSREVINYVSRTENAVGFIGYSWIGNSDDTAQLADRKKVKLAWVESTDSVGGYVKPLQFLIYTKSYPLLRDLVYVLKENHAGLGHGFARFLQEKDKGQLIFRRAYLMPAIWPNYGRNAQLRENIDE
jgi:phosphate transport system substrate-binding protein